MSDPCVFHSPPFHPKFESLSDDDLDTCELIALSILMGIPMTMASLDPVLEATSCFRSMTPRARREYEIWWVLYLTGCTTDAVMRRLINTVNQKTTRDERQAALTAFRTSVWDYAECADI